MTHPNDPRWIKPVQIDEPMFYVIRNRVTGLYMNEDNGFGPYAEAERFDRMIAWLPNDPDCHWSGPHIASEEP